ncbi:hypothetical protein Rhe02_89450 [Rhizocola hellebori]|uniref:Protein kinase domain-containing protein n=1 Tax=Rhizocola hellebori TaxID=1392758 RepID=A0A8J3QHB4_9ACTN|nr:serine/threonine-protein kinase [Rhizocola hellebori]GIH10878.1 hypothetical protein Rhe02_89450 [Rhizocola hellebori]
MAEQDFYLYEPNRKGDGRQKRVIDIEGDDRTIDGTILRQHGRLLVSNETVLVQTATTAKDVRILRHLTSMGELLLRGRRLPDTVAQLIGYDVDSDERAVVVTATRGDALATLNGELPLRGPAVGRAVSDLLHSLDFLAYRQLVHGNLNPLTVRWDGSSLQIGELEHLTIQGSNRTHQGVAPWASPEQLAGSGKTSCLDDVYSAGMLMLPMLTGEQPRLEELADQVSRQDVALRKVLRAALLDRISAGRIIDLMNFPRQTVVIDPPSTREAGEARRQFGELTQRHNAFLRAYYARPVATSESPYNFMPLPEPVPRKGNGLSATAKWILGLAILAGLLAIAYFGGIL